MKIGIVSLGCAKNLVNTEQMMYLLSEAGFDVSGETDGADVVVVNTCGFIESAKMEAIETIIELGRAKDEGQIGKIIVAGCLPQRYKKEILAEMPEIDGIVGTGSFEKIVEVVESALSIDENPSLRSAEKPPQPGAENPSQQSIDEKPSLFGDIDAPVSETGRLITTSPVWAYLKIAEGCDNLCAYCVIPHIRGKFRSRPMGKVIEEAKGLAAIGVEELIIVAQDVTRYGLDLYGKRSLAELLKGLCEIESIKWIRLHYLYPDEIDEELVDEIVENGKIMRYLDIPIQHINDGILQRMNRRCTGKEIRVLFRWLRERIPGLVLRTSIIAGLPGEGDAEFEELCGFLREAKIERAGFFPYSPEEGTPAALMDRPDSDIAARRVELLSDIQSIVMDEFNESRIGSVTTILIEGYEDGNYYGRSFAESPDIDGYITVKGGGVALHEFVDVRITGIENGELVGEV